MFKAVMRRQSEIGVREEKNLPALAKIFQDYHLLKLLGYFSHPAPM